MISQSATINHSQFPSVYHSRLRRGVVVLETILVLPILFICLLAIIEFGILFQVSQQVSFASRVGVKLAAESSRTSAENPWLENFNDESAMPGPPFGESLKERVDELLANGSLSESCQVIMEHNVAGVMNTVQVYPAVAPAGCVCEPQGGGLPLTNEHVRVTVCVPFSGNVPNLLATFGLDLSDVTISHSTVFRYERPAIPSGFVWSVGTDASDSLNIRPAILNEISAGPAWSEQTTPGTYTGTHSAVDFVDNMNGWAVGTGEFGDPLMPDVLPVVVRTIDGGASWTLQTFPDDGALVDVDFLDSMVGFAIGSEVGSLFPLVMRTTTGGDMWDTRNNVGAAGGVLNAVDFVDSSNGWFVGTNAGNAYVLSSADGAGSFTDVSPVGVVGVLNDVDFIDTTTGWAVGSDGAVPTIIKTTTGGVGVGAWVSQPLPALPSPILAGSLLSVDFVDAMNGWAVGQEVSGLNTVTLILSTSDGGATWARQTHPVSVGTLNSVDFIDANTGYAVGTNNLSAPLVAPYILKTINGGASWEIQTPPTPLGTLLDVSYGPQADE
ncbi:TadE/TadG family type IV pilus assembly protein [Thalassoglobus polymorphus]|uniref:TadE/TadG family type IV pilus assembly protein n=1 Tax=Thalassoglobus polymorphus TaxID=2527994 RepID=UPI0028F40A30|nr:TadE/TadG family type IV pilus assembly protein [Thalassoglobus polymorphus]